MAAHHPQAQGLGPHADAGPRDTESFEPGPSHGGEVFVKTQSFDQAQGDGALPRPLRNCEGESEQSLSQGPVDNLGCSGASDHRRRQRSCHQTQGDDRGMAAGVVGVVGVGGELAEQDRGLTQRAEGGFLGAHQQFTQCQVTGHSSQFDDDIWG